MYLYFRGITIHISYKYSPIIINQHNGQLSIARMKLCPHLDGVCFTIGSQFFFTPIFLVNMTIPIGSMYGMYYLLLWPLSVLGAIAAQDLFVES